MRQQEGGAREPGPKVRNSHTTPSEAFRRNLLNIRKRRRWRQIDLAERIGVDRTAISKIENGDRGVTLDEAIAISATLGVSPLSLISSDNAAIEVVRGEILDGFRFRQWLRGNAWVRPDDVAYMPAEVDAESWEKRQETSIQHTILSTTQKLLDAVDSLIQSPSNPEAVAKASKCLDVANAALLGHARAVAERSASRPVARLRIRPERDAA